MVTMHSYNLNKFVELNVKIFKMIMKIITPSTRKIPVGHEHCDLDLSWSLRDT